jgi:uncharacterized OB-fold protein
MPAWPPPIDDTLLSLDASGGPTLFGARARDDGRLVFPPPADTERFDPVVLPREGRLWSWTIQRFRPKSPPYAGSEDFAPYPVGYVELEGAIIVEARLNGAPAGGWRIGMPMRLVAEAFPMADGSVRSTYAFAPAEVAI